LTDSQDEARNFMYGPSATSIEQINNTTGTVMYLQPEPMLQMLPLQMERMSSLVMGAPPCRYRARQR
jgi:hypothetical protein